MTTLVGMNISAEDKQAVINRLRRAGGQLTAVVRMLEEDEDCERILTQLAAVGKALDKAGFQLVSLNLRECLTNSENGEIDTKRLERVFLSLA